MYHVCNPKTHMAHIFEDLTHKMVPVNPLKKEVSWVSSYTCSRYVGYCFQVVSNISCHPASRRPIFWVSYLQTKSFCPRHAVIPNVRICVCQRTKLTSPEVNVFFFGFQAHTNSITHVRYDSRMATGCLGLDRFG